VAVYNEFLVTVAELAQRDGHLPTLKPHEQMLNPLRNQLRTIGLVPRTDCDRVVDFVVLLRNVIIHRGARASAALVASWQGLTPDQKNRWLRGTRRQYRGKVGEKVRLGPPEVNGTFAVLNRSLQEINDALASLLRRDTWAQLAVEDYILEHPPIGHRLEQSRLELSVVGFAKFLYRPLQLTVADVRPPILSFQASLRP
jgi:hypothetical protein